MIILVSLLLVWPRESYDPTVDRRASRRDVWIVL